MPEDVNTGGLHDFRYPKGYSPKASEQRKREIKEAYARAEERKRREKKNKMIMWIVIALIILVIIGFAVYFLR